MKIRFRDFNHFNCWIWIHFSQPVQGAEVDYINALLDSWFILGRMGAFNTQNLQVYEKGYDISWMEYNNNIPEDSLKSIMNEMTQPEIQGDWARFWVDLGGSDSIALDLLINGMLNIDTDVVEIIELIIGGLNDDWPVGNENEDDDEPEPRDLMSFPL